MSEYNTPSSIKRIAGIFEGIQRTGTVNQENLTEAILLINEVSARSPYTNFVDQALALMRTVFEGNLTISPDENLAEGLKKFRNTTLRQLELERRFIPTTDCPYNPNPRDPEDIEHDQLMTDSKIDLVTNGFEFLLKMASPAEQGTL